MLGYFGGNTIPILSPLENGIIWRLAILNNQIKKECALILGK